eukprot:GHVQ01042738.1.p1 GENE.GHVQ01042738.1~~GHVQ01042738.1.p1  ORF type:complete len:494 (+),score=33.57 GHVQ01042738.1:100-1581(+)
MCLCVCVCGRFWCAESWAIEHPTRPLDEGVIVVYDKAPITALSEPSDVRGTELRLWKQKDADGNQLHIEGRHSQKDLINETIEKWHASAAHESEVDTTKPTFVEYYLDGEYHRINGDSTKDLQIRIPTVATNVATTRFGKRMTTDSRSMKSFFVVDRNMNVLCRNEAYAFVFVVRAPKVDPQKHQVYLKITVYTKGYLMREWTYRCHWGDPAEFPYWGQQMSLAYPQLTRDFLVQIVGPHFQGGATLNVVITDNDGNTNTKLSSDFKAYEMKRATKLFCEDAAKNVEDGGDNETEIVRPKFQNFLLLPGNEPATTPFLLERHMLTYTDPKAVPYGHIMIYAHHAGQVRCATVTLGHGGMQNLCKVIMRGVYLLLFNKQYVDQPETKTQLQQRNTSYSPLELRAHAGHGLTVVYTGQEKPRVVLPPQAGQYVLGDKQRLDTIKHAELFDNYTLAQCKAMNLVRGGPPAQALYKLDMGVREAKAVMRRRRVLPKK